MGPSAEAWPPPTHREFKVDVLGSWTKILAVMKPLRGSQRPLWMFFHHKWWLGWLDFLSTHAFHFKRQSIWAKENEQEGLYREFDLCSHFSNVPSILSSRAGIWYLYCLDHYITSFSIWKDNYFVCLRERDFMYLPSFDACFLSAFLLL